MRYDLGFKGLPVMWTGPSRNVLGPRAYNADQEAAAWTTPHFENLLKIVKGELGTDNITLIAHSMGNRIVGGAIDLADRERVFKPGAFKAII